MDNSKIGKLNDIDLDNSVSLNPKSFPTDESKFSEYIYKFANYIESLCLWKKTIRTPEMDNLALVNILTNLVLARDKSKLVAFSRNKNTYSEYSRAYGYNYFSYSRYIKIINALASKEIILVHNGYFDRNKGEGMNPRMTIAPDFIEKTEPLNIRDDYLEIDYYYLTDIGEIRYIADNSLVKKTDKFPTLCVILKDKKGKRIPHRISKKTLRMTRELEEYNQFIKHVEVVVPIREEKIKLRSHEPFVVKVSKLDKNKDNYYTLPVDNISLVDMVKILRSTLAFSDIDVNSGNDHLKIGY